MSCIFHYVVCLATRPEHVLKQRVISASLSSYSIVSFPYGHPVAAYVFFLFFPSLASFLQ